MKMIRILIIGAFLVIPAVVIVGTVSASNDWHGTKANVTNGGSKAIVRLWERGADAVLTYEVAGLVTDQTRCENGVLTDFDLSHNAAVIHADMSEAECTRTASSLLREPSRLVKSGKFTASSIAAGQTGQKRTAYVSADSSLPTIVLDDATGLPVSISYAGQPTTFTYDQIDSAAPPPAPDLKTTAYVEEYRAVGAADIAAALQVKSLPAQLGSFRLAKTFTYDSGPSTGRAYYAVWNDKAGRELQVVLNTRVAAGDSPYGFTDDGQQITFRVSASDTCLQVFAPDLTSMRAVVAAIRPDLSAQLEQQIAHPVAPQQKEAPPR